MNFKHFILSIIIITTLSCKQEKNHLNRIEGERIEINDSLGDVQAIEDFIKPFREHVNKDMDSILGYSVDTYSKRDGELNTAIGNLMVDAVYELSNPVYKSRTGKDIDMVLLNHGGIRSTLYKGNITTRTAYELMPFDNSIVVVEMKGHLINDLVSYLVDNKRAHPIHGLQIKLDASSQLLEATVNSQPIDINRTYHVATNDYLYDGGDKMVFFKQGDSLHVLDYKIRNVLVDFFKKHDTLSPTIDDRFIQIN
jgi:2',3'-cyclic-nucleotide 2'-phosphodiesterase (5'-nucleotidase family)